MRSDVYFLSGNRNNVANSIRDKFFVNSFIPSDVLDSATLLKIAQTSTTEFFYVVSSDYDFDLANFDFKFKPQEWDSDLVHIWNTDSRIKLFNRSLVLKNPQNYIDQAFLEGKIKIKDHSTRIITAPSYDIVLLSYDEPDTDNSYNNLIRRWPRIKRIHGVKGIVNAHRAAAEISSTEFFYVIDADAEILQAFDFDYYVHNLDYDSVHVWKSKNPVNGLEYGYGGVKLFPRKSVLNFSGNPADFTTTVTGSLKIVDSISNITRFNTDPFSAWRSGFREAVKLSAGLIRNADPLTKERLEIWCTCGEDADYGEFTIQGAQQGREFGSSNYNKPEILNLINDYSWLELKFTGD